MPSPLHEAALAAKRSRPFDASPAWNNASLLRKQVLPEPEQIEDPNVGPYEDPVSADSLIADAKATLNSPQSQALSNMARGLSDLPERAAAIGEGHQRPSLRALTETIAKPSPWLATAALGTGLTGIGAPATLPLAAASSALAAPDVLRRLIAPDADESRGGAALEGALMAAPAALPALKSGASAAMEGFKTGRRVNAARQAFETGATKAGRVSETLGPSKFGLGRELPYQMQAPTSNPNQVLETAREVAAETGESVESILKGYFKSSGVKDQRNPLMSLLNAGETSRTINSLRQARKDIADASNLRGAWGGDRSTGSMTLSGGRNALFPEPDDLAAVAAGKVKPNLSPNERHMAEIDEFAKQLGVSEEEMPELLAELLGL